MTEHAKLTVRGFFRGQLVNSETGKIEGDSGWVENAVTNTGLISLAAFMAGQAGSYRVSHMAVGEQTQAFNVTQTDLISRISDTHASSGFLSVSPSTSGTATATFTCQMASTIISASHTLGAVGLYYTSSAGSFIAGQTFATSQWNTNQDFNVTYQLRFATTT